MALVVRCSTDVQRHTGMSRADCATPSPRAAFQSQPFSVRGERRGEGKMQSTENSEEPALNAKLGCIFQAGGCVIVTDWPSGSGEEAVVVVGTGTFALDLGRWSTTF